MLQSSTAWRHPRLSIVSKLEVVTINLLVVVICNLLKVICLGSVLFLQGFYPLATFGDAVSSFLTPPDDTRLIGALSSKEVRQLKKRLHADRSDDSTTVNQAWRSS